MTVFKYFLKIAWHYKMMVFMYTAIFFVLSIVMTSQTSEDNSFSGREINMVIVLPNESSPLTENFVERLDKTNIVTISTESERELREKVFTGLIEAAIIIEAPIEEAFDQDQAPMTVITSTQSSAATLLGIELNQYFVFAKTQYKADGSVNLEKLNTVLDAESEVTIVSNNKLDSEELFANNWAAFFFRFLSYVLLSVLISFFGFLISDFEDEGVRTRTRLGSITLTKMNLLKLLSSAVIAVMIGVIFIVGAVILHPVLIGSSNFYQHIGIMALSITTILALAYLCAVIVGRNKNVFSGLSVTVGLGLSFISGVFVPLEFMSEAVVNVSKLFPVYYITRAHESVLAGTSYTNYLVILALFAVLYFVLALTVTRIRQTKG